MIPNNKRPTSTWSTTNLLRHAATESTSPKWRSVPMFLFGLGWGLGILLVPLLHRLTMDYRLYLCAHLLAQVARLIWLKLTLGESIRWLLSEGHTKRALVELRRACRLNGRPIRHNREFPNSITTSKQVPWQPREMKAPEVARRASASRSLSSTTTTTKSHLLEPGAWPQANPVSRSPSLGFTSGSRCLRLPSQDFGDVCLVVPDLARKPSTERLIELLLLRHSDGRKKQEAEAKANYFKPFAALFSRRLWPTTLLLVATFSTLETEYFGLIESNKFVGSNVDRNYMMGAVFEWVACLIYMFTIYTLSRRLALIVPTSMCSLVLLALALSYQMYPENNHTDRRPQNSSTIELSVRLVEPTGEMKVATSSLAATISSQNMEQQQKELIHLRDEINFWLIAAGKLLATVATQAVGLVAMESYPNSLRQTGLGVIMLMGRVGAISSPFLFDDQSPDKLLLKGTLLALASMGLVSSLLVPFVIRDTKNRELSDHLEQIDHESQVT